MSRSSRTFAFDPPLAGMIALLAIGSGAYVAHRTLPEDAAPRSAATATGTAWMQDFRALEARPATPPSRDITPSVDPAITAAIAAAHPLARPVAAAPSKSSARVATAPVDPASDARRPVTVAAIQPPPAAPTASAKAAAFGALAPAPWLKIRVEATQTAFARPRSEVVAAASNQPSAKPAPTDGAASGDAAMLGYAKPETGAEAPFRSLFKDGTAEGTVAPPANMPTKMHDWAYIGLKGDVWDKRQQRCLAEAIYFESRGENERGQAAVAQVVLNRVRNPAYPDTICEVVYQNSTWIDSCQFSFACDGRKEVITDQTAWKRAQRIATDVTAGKIYDRDVADATHYHAYWVRPSWRDTMKRVATIGVHRFYRTYGGGWI